LEKPGSAGSYLQEELELLDLERRISHRLSLQVPVTLEVPDTGLKVRGKTRDISVNGVFFYANLPVREHQEIELLLTLPYETAESPVQVAFRAKVLRIEQDATSGKKGMAAAIQEFHHFGVAPPTHESLEHLLDPH